MRRLSLEGQVFGHLTAIQPSPDRKGATQRKTRWKVRCSCGVEFDVDTSDLVRKDGRGRVSCGCMNHRRGEDSPMWLPRNRVPKTYLLSVKRGAVRRGLTWGVTQEYVQTLYDAQDGLCALTGRPIPFKKREDLISWAWASLDRIDSSEGYVPGNVQWVHASVNRMKSSLDNEDFIQFCREVVNHHDN